MNTHATSAARLHANQQNAQRSTGPRTPEGKSASSQNSTKHGLSCSDDSLARQYPAEVQVLVAGYAKQYAPKDQIMHDLLHQLASARLRQDRAAQWENLALQNEATLDQLALLTKLERYRKSAEASYHRALKQLQTIDARYKALEAQAIRAEQDRKTVAATLASGRQQQKQSDAEYAQFLEAVRSHPDDKDDEAESAAAATTVANRR